MEARAHTEAIGPPPPGSWHAPNLRGAWPQNPRQYDLPSPNLKVSVGGLLVGDSFGEGAIRCARSLDAKERALQRLPAVRRFDQETPGSESVIQYLPELRSLRKARAFLNKFLHEAGSRLY